MKIKPLLPLATALVALPLAALLAQAPPPASGALPPGAPPPDLGTANTNAAPPPPVRRPFRTSWTNNPAATSAPVAAAVVPASTAPLTNPAATSTESPSQATAATNVAVTARPLVSRPVPTNFPPRVAVPTLPATPSTPTPALPAVANALGATNVIPGGTNLMALAGDDSIIPAGMVAFQATPLEQVFMTYAELTGRTILRPNQLPAAAVTLKTQTDLTKAEAIQAMDSVLGLNGITMVNVGDRFVTAVPNTQILQEGVAFSTDDPKKLVELGQYVTKLITLKHARPSEVQQLLVGFSKVQNGIVAIDPTQTLILRDYPANIKRMMEIIEKLDVEVETDYKLEVIPIKYGKVEEIYATMGGLIGGGGGGLAGSSGNLSRTRTGQSTARNSSTRGSMSGRQSTTMGMQNRQLGQTTQAGQNLAGQTGTQQSFNQRLQGLSNRMGGSGQVELLGDARIVPDERSNSLIVFASKEDMQMITNIVAKVDRLLAQVLIEATIMDVKLTDNLSYGVSAAGKKGNSAAGMNNGQGFLDSVTNFPGALPSGFSYFGKYGGNMDLAVQALAAKGKGEVLQTPHVQTSHAVPASFFTGETVPYVTSTMYGGYGYGTSSSFQQMEVGIGLNVTPYITPDGLVVMDIQQTIEEISGYTEISGVGKVPNTSRREATATVSVQDRDTILLGGYIRTSKSKSHSGVPLLKDIPLLGAAFRSNSDDNSRSELIVLLRPTVLPTPHDAAIVAEGERLKLPGVRMMEKEMKEDEERRHREAERVTSEKKKK